MSTDKVISVTSVDEIPKTGKVVIDFYANWCGPCKKLSPEFARLSNEYENITFVKVDSDEADELCKEYQVTALPTIIFIKDGDVVSIIKGFNLSKLTSELDELSNL
jgi:thioredoxin 1